jgi:hypothetical protein
MATESRNKFSTLSQTPSDTLPNLVRRLRDHARGIKNAAAAQAMGQDILAAALVIEQQLILHDVPADMLVGDLPANEAMALAHMAHCFVYEDAVRFSNRSDNGAEPDAMLGGIGKLQSALADAGFAPR